MKQKFISLALAVMLLLGVTGCAMSTPARLSRCSIRENSQLSGVYN